MASAPHIVSVASAVPPHYASQETLAAALRKLWEKKHFNAERFEELHRAVKVSGRFLALPMDEYLTLDSFAKRNDAWLRVAVELGGQAVQDALREARLQPAEVDAIFFVTVTGVATPSVDARLVNRLALRADIKRTPIFGLGCVAGAAGLARAADYLRAFPTHTALLVSVELCSLTLQHEDLSIANIIASGLFGDGAAAVVLRGADRLGAGGPRVVASKSVFYPDTERVMGWDVVDTGFKVVLSSKVPQLVRDRIRGDVDAFLKEHGLEREDVAHWIVHTGGPKVLEAFEESLELARPALERSWRSLGAVGNLSSASVLWVLQDFLEAEVGRPGDLGLVLAMGPGFCSELVLLSW
jgi:alkylresorcinol/alkylpyrone synthase